MRVLNEMARSGPLVFPATRGRANERLSKTVDEILKLGEVPSDITPNVLRHSFISLGADIGYGDVTIGAIVRHEGPRPHPVTYISQNSVLLSAADAIADQTAALMAGASARPR